GLGDPETITLIPYGAAKVRITVFPKLPKEYANKITKKGAARAILGLCPNPPFRELFEKSSLKTLKNFERMGDL
ncbi:MAG: hypothetical protein IJZ37_07185, partial [Clostridia bacterium]|nr:hypothetical protein [Clostridia bacterium]